MKQGRVGSPESATTVNESIDEQEADDYASDRVIVVAWRLL
jgi:hypothetical protein